MSKGWVTQIVMLLGVTDMEAEQIDKYALEEGLYNEIDSSEASVAELKGFYAMVSDEYRRANNIETKSL
jgi:hypothetical protein